MKIGFLIFLTLIFFIPNSWGGGGVNLIPNGDFEEGDTMPYHWGTRVRLGSGFRILLSSPAHPRGRVKEGVNLLWNKGESPWGKCVELFLNEPAPRYSSICEVEGMEMGSEFIPLDPKKKYNIEVDVKSTGPSVIVFVKVYKEDEKVWRREVYRAPLFCHFQKEGEWAHFRRRKPFPTTRFPPQAKWMRVILYAYGGNKGIVYFDNVRLYEVEE